MNAMDDEHRAYPTDEPAEGSPGEDREWLEIFRAAVDAAYDAILITDAELDRPGPRILHANPAFCRMTGYRLDEVLGRTPRLLQGPDTERRVLRRLRRALERGQRFEAKAVNYRKDGSPFLLEWRVAPVFDDAGDIRYYVAIQRDVTDYERRLNMLRRQAEVDPLTGAWNRREVERLLEVEMERAERQGTPLSVLLLDIDSFKPINDEHGHPTGDEVLRRLTQTIGGRLRNSDHLGRWGGDEFLVVLPFTDGEHAQRAAESLRETVAGTIFAEDVALTVSIGVTGHEPGDAPADLVARTDRALYAAKGAGRDAVASA